jgi:transcriptional regulator with XRE-family HTH domain
MNPLLHIRKNVFGVTQADMAEIAKVSQGTVSKWEKGSLVPDRSELARIRDTAALRGLSWSDSWLFEAPSEAAE